MMGRLEKYTVEQNIEVVQKPVRIPADLFREFEAIYSKLGMSFNKAVVLLIQAEVEEVRREKEERKKKRLRRKKDDQNSDSKDESKDV